MPAFGHGGRAVLVGVLEVVGRERAVAGGQRRATAGSRAGRHAASPAGRARAALSKTRSDLRGREGDALAEAVDRVGQALGRDGRQHLVGDKVR